jgi:integrase
MAEVLTDRAVKAHKPAAHRFEIPDGGLPGLYLIVHPTGRKSWAVRYRHQGTSRKLTLKGYYPAVGLAAARERAIPLLRDVSEGGDPVGDQKAKGAAPDGDTFGAAAARYLASVAKTHRAANQVERYFRVEILPVWGTRRLADIKRRDVAELIDAIETRGAPHAANSALRNVRRFFNWCLQKDLLGASPCVGLKPPAKSIPRDRVLNNNELRWLWQATEDLSLTNGNFIKMLLLTGQRRNEVAGINTAELNGSEWTLPRARTKNKREHCIVLPRAAVQTLADCPIIGTAGFFFTVDGVKPICGFSYVKILVDKAVAARAKVDGVDSIPPWTLHDLRRTVASGMARLGIEVHVTEAVLNHRSGVVSGVAAVYITYDFASEKAQALARWAAELDRIVHAHPEPRKVVKLRG